MSSNLLIFVLVIVLGCCTAAPQFRARDKIAMENEQVLDPNNQFVLRWTVINSTGEIQIEMQANCTGWLGFGFTYDELYTRDSLGDIIMGGYNDETGQGYVEDRSLPLLVPIPGGGGIDKSQDVQLVSAAYEEPWTIVRVSRKIDTGDLKDVPFVVGPALVYWSRATYDDTSIPHEPHDNGSAYVTFISDP